MSKGIMMYAHNNSEVDYLNIAITNAMLIKKNLKPIGITLVTDKYTMEYTSEENKKYVDELFENIIIFNIDHDQQNMKIFRDTGYSTKKLKWTNGGRPSAYDITPYDETLLIDSDYLVMDNSIDRIWGSNEDILINRNAMTIGGKQPREKEQFLSIGGVPMYWATKIYFKKCEKAFCLFELAKHVKENYQYYATVYDFNHNMYRNDYAFSVAIHIMSDGIERNGMPSFDNPTLLTSFDYDDIVKYEDNSITFIHNDSEFDYEFTGVKIKNQNVHVLNKYAIGRISETIKNEYKKENV